MKNILKLVLMLGVLCTQQIYSQDSLFISLKKLEECKLKKIKNTYTLTLPDANFDSIVFTVDTKSIKIKKEKLTIPICKLSKLLISDFEKYMENKEIFIYNRKKLIRVLNLSFYETPQE